MLSGDADTPLAFAAMPRNGRIRKLDPAGRDLGASTISTALSRLREPIAGPSSSPGVMASPSVNRADVEQSRRALSIRPAGRGSSYSAGRVSVQRVRVSKSSPMAADPA